MSSNVAQMSNLTQGLIDLTLVVKGHCDVFNHSKRMNTITNGI